MHDSTQEPSPAQAEVPFHPAAATFPMLTGDDFRALAENIAAHGLREPIVLCDGAILDGRNRYAACLSVGVAPRFEEYTGDDPVAYAWSLNATRRHLTPSQLAACSLAVEAAYAEQARARQGTRTDLGETIPQGEAGRAKDKAAALTGANPHYITDAKAIRAADPAMLDAVKAGTVTIPEARRELKRREVAARIEETGAREAVEPTGRYDVLVIDPPWPIQKIERDVRPNQVGLDYPTMSLGELAALDLPTADDCHVWLWTTHKFLPAAFDLLGAWGLRYVCTFVWHKPGGFQPVGLPQYNCEFALYARRGSPVFVETKALPTCFEAPRGAHSEKPAKFYEVVRRVTGGRRLDMFNRRQIEGFDGWGLEAV